MEWNRSTVRGSKVI